MEVHKIIVHHSASPKSTTIEQITRWHRERGFNTIGYHAVVDGGGTPRRGRCETIMGAHARDNGGNRNSLGVCVTGNFNHERPSNEQLQGLLRVLTYWANRHEVPVSRILGHRDFRGNRPDDCPGANLYPLLPALRKEVGRRLALIRRARVPAGR